MLSNLCPEINAKGISTILVTENRFELFRKPVIFMEDVSHRLAPSAGDNKKPSIAAYSAQWGKWGVHMDIVISLRILFNIIFVSASVSHCQSIIWIVLLFAAIYRAEYTITSNF